MGRIREIIADSPHFSFLEIVMAKLKEIYSYDNPKFGVLRDPARAVIAAYQNANRFLDTVQEYALIEEGMPNLARAIHEQAHLYPTRFDKFAEMLHERHLMAEYPATPEMDWRTELNSLDDVFRCILSAMEEIQEALEAFYVVTDGRDFRPMALTAEDLMSENSADYTRFLEMWARWDNEAGSKTSFDSWVCRLFGFGEDEED